MYDTYYYNWKANPHGMTTDILWEFTDKMNKQLNKEKKMEENRLELQAIIDDEDTNIEKKQIATLAYNMEYVLAWIEKAEAKIAKLEK